MEIITALALAVALSMDAFAVSVCKGLSVKSASWKQCSICGAWFGGFQALMPIIGFFLGSLFAKAITAFDHWVACGLLVLIGANMLKEAFGEEEEVKPDFSAKTMFIMAVATSIDALAVGITLALDGANLWLNAPLIGCVTFALSFAGVKIGNLFGSRYQKPAQITGGVILILLGLKIVLEHLGVLA